MALLVQVREHYGTREIAASPVYPGEGEQRGELLTPMFETGGAYNEVADLEITAYVDTEAGVCADGGPYGFEVCFRPHRVALYQAEAMTRTLRRLTRGLRDLDETRGYVREGDFLTYLTRVAELLGIRHYYLYGSQRHREMTGERYDRVDGGGLQQWLRDVAKNNYPLSKPRGGGESW